MNRNKTSNRLEPDQGIYKKYTNKKVNIKLHLYAIIQLKTISQTPLHVRLATEYIIMLLNHIFRGGSRIIEKGGHMYKGVGVSFADFIYFVLNIS